MITRDNYEEFFLLYVDNELSATDRRLVERFVADNPDMGEEWESLLQCRLEPERFIFPGKEELIKEEENPWPEKIFEPDMTIVFPGKESLYRKEKHRRVVLYPWWRVAAAALILIAAGGYFFLPVKKQDSRLAAGVSRKKDTPAVTPATTAALYPTESTEKKKPEEKQEKPRENQTKPVPAIKKKTDPAVAQIMSKEKTPEIRAVEPTVLPQQVTRPEEHSIAAVDPGEIARPLTAPEEIISKENSSFATQALLNNATTANDDNNYGAEPASQKKNKLRGIFRRASRVFEKTADRDDDGQRKVLIGAFQFALK
jgi:hypothetical protein